MNYALRATKSIYYVPTCANIDFWLCSTPLSEATGNSKAEGLRDHGPEELFVQEIMRLGFNGPSFFSG